MPKAATAKSGEAAGERKRATGAKARKQSEALNLEKFKDAPVKSAALILGLRRDKITSVLASPEFDIGIKRLASKAAAEPRAAAALSKFVAHAEFSRAVVAAVKTAERWPEPSKFKSDDRQLAADALARLRPSWALSWLAQALLGTQPRYAKQRHFFASRLILASGGLMEAAGTLAGNLLLDEKIVALVMKADADAGAKLREDAAKLANGVGHRPPETPPSDQASILEEAAWSDADEALGRALRDMGVLDRSFQRLESVVDGEVAERTHHAQEASNLVLQWVRQAAHQRTIKALNSVGDRIQFDPLYYDLYDDAAPGDYVRVVKPSIVRGSGSQLTVLVRGEAELD